MVFLPEDGKAAENEQGKNKEKAGGTGIEEQACGKEQEQDG